MERETVLVGAYQRAGRIRLPVACFCAASKTVGRRRAGNPARVFQINRITVQPGVRMPLNDIQRVLGAVFARYIPGRAVSVPDAAQTDSFSLSKRVECHPDMFANRLSIRRFNGAGRARRLRAPALFASRRAESRRARVVPGLADAENNFDLLWNHTLWAVQCRLGPGGGYARSGQLQSFAHRARAHVQQRL